MSQSPLYPQGPGQRAKPELASPRQTNDPGQGVRADPGYKLPQLCLHPQY